MGMTLDSDPARAELLDQIDVGAATIGEAAGSLR